MKINVYAKGRNNRYDSQGIFNESGLTILAGSKISKKTSGKQNVISEEKRRDKNILSDDMILKTNVTFKSPTAAACFVTGYISNGNTVWKTEDGSPLSASRKTQIKRRRKEN